MKPELLEKLNWLAAKHVTSEYRTTTIDEDDARQILTAIQAAPQVVYQHSIDTTGGWQDCSKYDYELFHVDERRTLYTSPPSGGEVVYQQRTFGNRHETWRDIPKHEYDQLVLPSNGRILYPSPMVVDDDMLDAACEAYADMYDVEYIDGNNRDNRRACIKAALQAALEAK